MDEQLFLLQRLRPTDANVGTIYADDEIASFKAEQLYESIKSDNNVEYIIDRIIERVDPLRNNTHVGSRLAMKEKVLQYLESWNNLGRFNKSTIPFEGKVYEIKTVSPIALLDHYNREFVNVFAESILPIEDVTKVSSVVNPNGLYAQQERLIRINSKPVPFYERSLYKRLHDTNLDQRIDEVESPFYKMDHNPRMSDTERKKRDLDPHQLPTYMDRVGLSYRMKPNY